MPAATDDLVRATAGNHVSWMAARARAVGGETWLSGRVLCIRHGDDVTVPFPERLNDDVLDEIFERDPATVGVWALADDDELDARLVARGFERGWWPHWMAADARDLALDEDDRVALTDHVPEYDDYGRALLSLTRPRPRRFWHAVARVDGAYAGHAWAHNAAGVAGIYDVDVLPRARRHGLGRALTGVVAGAAGARWAVLNATGQGERLYAALGFRSLGHGRTWWRHRPPSRP